MQHHTAHSSRRLSHAAAWMSTISSRLLETKSRDVECREAISVETLKLRPQPVGGKDSKESEAKHASITEHHRASPFAHLGRLKKESLKFAGTRSKYHHGQWPVLLALSCLCVCVCVCVVWGWSRSQLHPCHFESVQ